MYANSEGYIRTPEELDIPVPPKHAQRPFICPCCGANETDFAMIARDRDELSLPGVLFRERVNLSTVEKRALYLPACTDGYAYRVGGYYRFYRQAGHLRRDALFLALRRVHRENV